MGERAPDKDREEVSSTSGIRERKREGCSRSPQDVGR